MYLSIYLFIHWFDLFIYLFLYVYIFYIWLHVYIFIFKYINIYSVYIEREKTLLIRNISHGTLDVAFMMWACRDVSRCPSLFTGSKWRCARAAIAQRAPGIFRRRIRRILPGIEIWYVSTTLYYWNMHVKPSLS